MNPRDVGLYASFEEHVGGMIMRAGVGVRFGSNQPPGIRFLADPPTEYRAAILRGLSDAMEERFPRYLERGQLAVTRIDADEVGSSNVAFERAARLVIEQARAYHELTRGSGA